MPVSDTAHQYKGNSAFYHGAQHVCSYCNKSFAKIQELKRHEMDKHMPPRRCPFCEFMWTRPYKIKAHITAHHAEEFTAEILEGIKASSGRHFIEFLDAYDNAPSVEAVGGMATASWAPNRAASDVGLQVRDKGEGIEDMNDQMDATTLLCQSVPTTSETTQDRDIGNIETIPESSPITEMVIDHPRLNFLGEALV
jgi:hypothetical protein